MIAAPEGSVTDPVIEPYVDCPCRNEPVERKKATDRATANDLRDIVATPTFLWQKLSSPGQSTTDVADYQNLECSRFFHTVNALVKKKAIGCIRFNDYLAFFVVSCRPCPRP